jgi:hypothetical protein
MTCCHHDMSHVVAPLVLTLASLLLLLLVCAGDMV